MVLRIKKLNWNRPDESWSALATQLNAAFRSVYVFPVSQQAQRFSFSSGHWAEQKPHVKTDEPGRQRAPPLPLGRLDREETTLASECTAKRTCIDAHIKVYKEQGNNLEEKKFEFNAPLAARARQQPAPHHLYMKETVYERYIRGKHKKRTRRIKSAEN